MSASEPTLVDGFSYTPLSKNSNIRVLKVEAGRDLDEIVSALCETPLESGDQVEYEAISYVWGNPTKTHCVVCDGSFLGITANLHAALRALRNRDRSRVLWADAICINQDENNERNEQVALMKTVYKRAQRVLIWLGERDARDDGAYEMIKLLGRFFEDNKTQHPHKTTLYPGQLSFLPPLWHCLRAFFQRPWFTRTWVVQEVGNAREGLVVWGGLSVGLEDLLKVEAGIHRMHLLTKLSLDDQGRFVSYDQTSRGLKCLEIIRLWRNSSTDFGLLTWLYLTRNLDATDPRDKVFWHYGNLHLSLNNQFPVNYSAAVEAVYRDLTISLIARDDLDILSFVSHSSEISSILLPSWVPDWTVRQYGTPFPMFSRHFRAAGDAKKSFSVSGSFLKVKGILADRSASFTPLTRDRDRLEGSSISVQPAHLVHWLLNAKSMTDQADPYPSGESIETAFWKTLVCNTGSDGRAILDEYFAHFKAFTRYVQSLSRPEDSDLEESTANMYDDKNSATKFMNLFKEVSADRVFCITQNGFMGWVPSDTQPEDLICIFYGGNYPYVIRPVGGNYYKFIGDCYIHGMMHGEALDNDRLEEREFWLR